jgi:DNA-binding NarL/FixJ family response regulator
MPGAKVTGVTGYPISVFVVDDHPSYQAVAGAVVAATERFTLCGVAGSADEAVEQILASSPPPDLLLLDVNLGDRNGVDVAAAVHAARPEIKIIYVSALAAHELPPGARSETSAGYLPKLELSPAALQDVWTGAYDWRP